MQACEATKLIAFVLTTSSLMWFRWLYHGIAGFASELRNHLIVEHATQLLKDQVERNPPALRHRSTAAQKPTPLLSSSDEVPETATRSRGSRRARLPQRADSAPRSEPTPVGSLWHEVDESKLQVSACTRMIRPIQCIGCITLRCCWRMQMELQGESLQELSTRAASLGCDPQWLAMTCKAGDEKASQAKLIHWCTQHAKGRDVPSVASVGKSDTVGLGRSPAQKEPPQRKSRGRAPSKR